MAHDQEVEAEGREAADQEQRVGADEAGLGAADQHADAANRADRPGDDLIATQILDRPAWRDTTRRQP